MRATNAKLRRFDDSVDLGPILGFGGPRDLPQAVAPPFIEPVLWRPPSWNGNNWH